MIDIRRLFVRSEPVPRCPKRRRRILRDERLGSGLTRRRAKAPIDFLAPTQPAVRHNPACPGLPATIPQSPYVLAVRVAVVALCRRHGAKSSNLATALRQARRSSLMRVWDSQTCTSLPTPRRRSVRRHVVRHSFQKRCSGLLQGWLRRHASAIDQAQSIEATPAACSDRRSQRTHGERRAVMRSSSA